MNATQLSAEQAYADILPRINELASLDSEKLEGAMKDLKGALLQNPSAAELMLPEDIGAMVSALRKLTGQTIVEAAKTKKSGGTGSRKKNLTAEEMEAVFDEL